MRLTPDILMMLTALFPDYVDIQFAPSSAELMRMASFDDPFGILMKMRKGEEFPTTSAMKTEDIPLEEIADGVYAGMSKMTHTLFVKVLEKGDYG